MVVAGRAFAISTTEPQVALRPVALGAVTVAVVVVDPVVSVLVDAVAFSAPADPVVVVALADVSAEAEPPAAGDVDADAVVEEEGAVLDVAVLEVALVTEPLAGAALLDVDEAAGAEQISVTRSPALTKPRRETAVPSTRSVAGAAEAASVASLLRAVTVLAAASTETISAWNCGPLGAGWVVVVVVVVVVELAGGVSGALPAVWACTTPALSNTPRMVVRIGVFMRSPFE